MQLNFSAIYMWFNLNCFHQYYTDRFSLDPIVLTVVETIDSTNRLLAQQLLENKTTCFYQAVIAQTQTAGRGQWGRTWTSEVGGLYLSLGFNKILNQIPNHIPHNILNHIPNDRFSLIPLAVAWGVANRLKIEGIPVQLKWPNDLILQRRKLGGILVETKSSSKIIIGIGINWDNHPPEPGIALQAYQHQESIPAIGSLEQLTAIVLAGIIDGCKEWLNPEQSLPHCIDRYEAILSNIGQWVPVGNQMGKVLGITATGSLRVQGEETELYFPPGTLQLGY
jgi:BirA family biotin operon repressor/biotin-[acetyl-CoA-carboxylase] ligase